jgi:hypothetical protein
MSLPGFLFGLPLLFVVVLKGIVGVALGLFLSALVRSSEMATSLVPLILIPQILFCGLVGVPQGLAKVVGVVMPATWAFDELKRLSPLDTLREEGASDGLGLYKRIEETNEANIATARTEVEDYRGRVDKDLNEHQQALERHLAARANGIPSEPPAAPTIGPPPAIPDAEVLSEDLSNYVSFKHPWGQVLLNPSILLIMLFTLIVMTIISLRLKDTR